MAGQLTLAWDPNPESNIAGYRLSYGTASGSYTTTIDVGNVTSYTVTNLTVGQRYFLVIAAYNTTGLVSPPSTEVNGVVPCTSSISPTQFTAPIAGGNGTVTVVAGACSWTATSSASWLTITSGATGSGNGTVSFTAAANSSPSLRTATLTIDGRSLTVTQPAQISTAGNSTLVWQNDATRQVRLWSMNGTNLASSVTLPTSATGFTVVGGGDFNQDGNLDVVLQDDVTRQLTIWYVNAGTGTVLGSSLIGTTGSDGWTTVAVADFDGDGHPDVVWQNDTTRQVLVWYLGGTQGNTLLRWAWLASGGMPGWTVVGAADFNADGHPDLIWQNDTTRQAVVWFMAGVQGDTMVGSASLSSGAVPGYTVAGAADFNGDHLPDLVWQNDMTRELAVWYLGGPQGNVIQGYASLPTSNVAGWRAVSPLAQVGAVTQCVTSISPTQFAAPIAGGSSNATVTASGCAWTATSSVAWLTITSGATGTGNGTVNFTVASNPSTSSRTGTLTIGTLTLTVTQAGQISTTAGPTVIWQNDATRQVRLWSMNGTNLASSVTLPTSATGFTVVGGGDFNQDGNLDVVLQDDVTRQLTIWYVNAGTGTVLGSSLIGTTGSDGWTTVAVADFDGDGHPDVVWQNDTTRQVLVWYLGGTQGNTLLRWAWLASGGVPGWTVVGAADFNADGHPDLIWQNDTTRQAVVWFMAGAQGDTMMGSATLSGAVPGYTVAGAADFNGDHLPDLVWQNDMTRELAVWYLGGPQGNVIQGYASPPASNVAGWRAILP